MPKKFLIVVTLLLLVLGASLVAAQDDLSAIDPTRPGNCVLARMGRRAA